MEGMPAPVKLGVVFAVAVAVMVIGAAIGLAVSHWSITTPEDAPSSNPTSCPTPLKKDGPRVVIDWAPGVTWMGTFYLLDFEQTAVDPGPQVFTVVCSLLEIAPQGEPVSSPFPDRTSTALRSGTSVHTIVGMDQQCYLTAQIEGTWRRFVADKTDCRP